MADDCWRSEICFDLEGWEGWGEREGGYDGRSGGGGNIGKMGFPGANTERQYKAFAEGNRRSYLDFEGA